jgi:hypothetical protein
VLPGTLASARAVAAPSVAKILAAFFDQAGTGKRVTPLVGR